MSSRGVISNILVTVKYYKKKLLIASDVERARSREHPSAVTHGTSQQQHISLSIYFRQVVHSTKIFFSYVGSLSVTNLPPPT